MRFDRSVFINCPLDAKYINDLLKPILYVLTKNGFTPRLALEFSDSGQVRLEKITDIIKSCKYGIHDLSIVESTKPNELARMNMPFELGIDYGLRKSGISLLSIKQFLILVATKYDYMKALSDISGFDVKAHDNNTMKLFHCLYTWSSETLKINKQAPPLKLFHDFANFNTRLYEEKAIELGSEEFAKNYIETVSIPEYIQEVQERL